MLNTGKRELLLCLTYLSCVHVAFCNPSGWKSNCRPCIWHSQVNNDYHNKVQLTFVKKLEKLNANIWYLEWQNLEEFSTRICDFNHSPVLSFFMSGRASVLSFIVAWKKKGSTTHSFSLHLNDWSTWLGHKPVMERLLQKSEQRIDKCEFLRFTKPNFKIWTEVNNRIFSHLTKIESLPSFAPQLGYMRLWLFILNIVNGDRVLWQLYRGRYEKTLLSGIKRLMDSVLCIRHNESFTDSSSHLCGRNHS